MQHQYVLVLNCGSSSLKLAVIDMATGDQITSALAERLEDSEKAVIHWKTAAGKESFALEATGHAAAINKILQLLDRDGLTQHIVAAGHRVVHGGEKFTSSCLIDDEVIAHIQACVPLAPLHNPAALQGIKALRAAMPNLPMAATFDTSFHQTMPETAYLYPVPYELYQEQEVRRYGFHGTSHAYVSARAAEMIAMPREEAKIIVAHLGNGCSACAVDGGRSVDTTMGLTPLDGLMMGTRSGSIDPGIFSYLADHCDMSIEEIDNMLNKKSGLLGISGLSNDCRSVEEAAATGNHRAVLAIDMFCYRLASEIAGLATTLGRIDALAFTGGIGENGPDIRAKVLDRLGILGFVVDVDANNATIRGKEGIITKPDSTKALVIATNEELVIARDAMALIA